MNQTDTNLVQLVNAQLAGNANQARRETLIGRLDEIITRFDNTPQLDLVADHLDAHRQRTNIYDTTGGRLDLFAVHLGKTNDSVVAIPPPSDSGDVMTQVQASFDSIDIAAYLGRLVAYRQELQAFPDVSVVTKERKSYAAVLSLINGLAQVMDGARAINETVLQLPWYIDRMYGLQLSTNASYLDLIYNVGAEPTRSR